MFSLLCDLSFVTLLQRTFSYVGYVSSASVSQWRFYIGDKPPKSLKKKDLTPIFQRWYIIFFRWSGNTESELTGSAVATCTCTYEVNAATASVKFVDSSKI